MELSVLFCPFPHSKIPKPLTVVSLSTNLLQCSNNHFEGLQMSLLMPVEIMWFEYNLFVIFLTFFSLVN